MIFFYQNIGNSACKYCVLTLLFFFYHQKLQNLADKNFEHLIRVVPQERTSLQFDNSVRCTDWLRVGYFILFSALWYYLNQFSKHGTESVYIYSEF